MKPILEQLDDKRSAARLGGGEKRIAAQHDKGKLTARERLDVLLDPGSFEETGMFVEHQCTDFGMGAIRKIPGDGVGDRFRHGERPAGLCVRQGLHRVLAVRSRWPMPGKITPAAGNRAEKKRRAHHRPVLMPAARASRKVSMRLGGYAEIFQNNVLASGVIPQISVIMGPCAGG